MEVLSFSSPELFEIIVSIAGYTSLAASVVVWLRMGRLSRQVAELRHREPHRDGASRPDRAARRDPAADTPVDQREMAEQVKSWGSPEDRRDPILARPAPFDPLAMASFLDHRLRRAEPRAGDHEQPAADPTAAGIPSDGRAVAMPEPERSPAPAADPEPAIIDLAAGGVAPPGEEIAAGPRTGSEVLADGDDRGDGRPRQAASAVALRVPVPGGRPRRRIDAAKFQGGRGPGQDRVRVCHSDPAQNRWWAYAVVCDGVRESGDGAEAAETAVRAFSETLDKALAMMPAPAVFRRHPRHYSDTIWNAAKSAHEATRQLSRDPLLRGSAATLDAALVLPAPGGEEHIAVLLHIGDGSIWTMDADRFTCETSEATGESGIVPALGAAVDLEAELLWVPMPPGRHLVLASDGFEKGLRGRDSEEFDQASAVGRTLVVSGGSAEGVVNCLGGLAVEQAHDDVTVAVLATART